jgi:hypothetical protein
VVGAEQLLKGTKLEAKGWETKLAVRVCGRQLTGASVVQPAGKAGEEERVLV